MAAYRHRRRAVPPPLVLARMAASSSLLFWLLRLCPLELQRAVGEECDRAPRVGTVRRGRLDGRNAGEPDRPDGGFSPDPAARRSSRARAADHEKALISIAKSWKKSFVFIEKS